MKQRFPNKLKSGWDGFHSIPGTFFCIFKKVFLTKIIFIFCFFGNSLSNLGPNEESNERKIHVFKFKPANFVLFGHQTLLLFPFPFIYFFFWVFSLNFLVTIPKQKFLDVFLFDIECTYNTGRLSQASFMLSNHFACINCHECRCCCRFLSLSISHSLP